MTGKILGSIAAIAVAATPIAASAAPAAAPASKLSLSNSPRAAAKTGKADRLAGQSVIPVLIGVGVLAGVTYLIIDKENDDNRSDSN